MGNSLYCAQTMACWNRLAMLALMRVCCDASLVSRRATRTESIRSTLACRRAPSCASIAHATAASWSDGEGKFSVQASQRSKSHLITPRWRAERGSERALCSKARAVMNGGAPRCPLAPRALSVIGFPASHSSTLSKRSCQSPSTRCVMYRCCRCVMGERSAHSARTASRLRVSFPRRTGHFSASE